MKNCIIGTAGHIDHGKTELIRALTGRETDTLKEEKVRGISIDLGFTYCDLPNGIRAGIVDVPGHEKFLSNMLAGVCGIDLVLLVIALDEGIKPQTLEHMEILSQLQVKQGIVVLTKLDCVEQEWAELMEDEIAEGLQGTVCALWPRVRVSSKTGEGIERLKQLLAEESGSCKKERNRMAAFRMPIDRVFSLEGRGTVIAGTVLEGKICPEERVEIYPTGKCVRIRGIQSHGDEIACACAGQRAALLVAGIKKEEVQRGHVAAAERTLRLSERLDVKIRMAKDTKRKIKNRMRLHLHIGTCQCVCRVVLFGCEELKAGEEGYAQLLLEEPLAVKKRDLFILRFYSPLETIGGGIVLDECARKQKRSDAGVTVRLAQMEEGKNEQLLLGAIKAAGDRLLCMEELTACIGLDVEMTVEMISGGEINGVHILEGKRTKYVTSESQLNRWERQSMEWLEEYRKVHPYQSEIPKAALQKAVFPKWDKERFEVVFHFFSSPIFPVQKDERFWKIREYLLQQLNKARFQFLKIGELCPKKLSEEQYRELIGTLVNEGELVHISEDYYTTSELIREAIEQTEIYFQEHEVLTYTVLKNLLGTTRRSVKALVSYFDIVKITKPAGGETERVKGAFFY